MREKERERLSEDQGERVCVRDKNIIKAEDGVSGKYFLDMIKYISTIELAF